MRRYPRPRPLAPCLLAGGLALTGCPERPEPIAPVRVGVLVPLSGAQAGVGKSRENAARLVAEQVNASGGLFEGREMELIVEDTGSEPGPAREAAARLLEAGVVAIAGPSSSDETAEVLPLTSEARVPLVSCCADANDLTVDQTANQGYFLRTTPPDEGQALALAYLASYGKDGAHPSFDGDGDGESFAGCADMIIAHADGASESALAARLEDTFEGAPLFEWAGGEPIRRTRGGGLGSGRVLAMVAFTSGFAADAVAGGRSPVTDALGAMSPVGDALRAAGGYDPEENLGVCTVIVGYPDDGAAVLGALVQLLDAYETEIDAAAPPFSLPALHLGSTSLNDPGFAAAAGALGPRLLGLTPTHARNDAYAAFAGAYRARFAAEPPPLSAQMYDATMLLALAVTAAQSEAGEAIRNEVYAVSREGQRFDGRFFGEMAGALLRGDDIDYVGPSGGLDFDETGNVAGDYALWRVEQAGGGAYLISETDFLPADDFEDL